MVILTDDLIKHDASIKRSPMNVMGIESKNLVEG